MTVFSTRGNRSVHRTNLKKWWISLKKEKTLLLMCMPAVVFFFVFSYLTMPGIYIAFVDYNYNLGLFASKFIGFKNFEYLTKSGSLFLLIKNTVAYNVIFIITSTVAQVALALLLNEMRGKIYKKISQTVMILPYFISFVIVGLFAYNLLNYEHGLINSVRDSFKLSHIAFYSQSWYWPFILVFTNLWKGVGYGSIIYFASLMSVDTEMLEAAQIDGASTIQRIRYMLLPSLKATIIILTLFSIGGILRGNFGLFYNLVGSNNPTLLNSTDIIETYTYRAMMNNFQFSAASAVSLVQSVFGFVLVITSNTIVKKIDPDYSLF